MMTIVDKQSEEFSRRIKAHAKIHVEDNILSPSKMDYLIVENAMIIGAMIQLEILKEKP